MKQLLLHGLPDLIGAEADDVVIHQRRDQPVSELLFFFNELSLLGLNLLIQLHELGMALGQ
ncbi:hypothetical protein D3C76_1361810 [compost metagenome]